MNDQKKYLELAERVIQISRNNLVVKLRFMDSAISILRPVPMGEIETCATDGQHIMYNPIFILKAYKSENNYPVHLYLHMILHCVFRHFMIDTLLDEERWGLACDIAVESIINELAVKCTDINKNSVIESALNNVKKKVKFVTAEYLYRYFLDNVSNAEVAKLRQIFTFDDHYIWFHGNDESESDNSNGDGQDNQDSQKKQSSGGDGKGGSDGEQSETDAGGQNADCDGKDNQKDKNSGGNGQSGSNDEQSDRNEESQSSDALSNQELEQIWKDISEHMQVDLETFSNGRHGDAGSLLQNLKAINREKYDFTEFLKKFAVMGEEMKINDDEFDYIFYTYGMSQYAKQGKRLPLIEPLEYKDVKRIKEFVLAIDTSGSVVGDLVQKFVQKAYNVLKSTESYFTKVNIHIIQCDTEIQEDKKITSQEEFDEYIKTMKLHGFGGNNEVRLFKYIDELIKKKEFTNLKGMVYFTDGYGIFPNKKPNYEVAFVFLNERYEIPEVPPWVIRLVLQSDEI